MKTEFHPLHAWASYEARAPTVRSLLDLARASGGEGSHVQVAVGTETRTVTASTWEDAKRLLDPSTALDGMTSLHFDVTAGPNEGVSVYFSASASGASARLRVRGLDEAGANAVLSQAVGLLEAGALEPPSAPVPLTTALEQLRAPVRLRTFKLAPRRFAGTYGDIDSLVRQMGDLFQQVHGTADFVYVAVHERNETLTVQRLDDLDTITGRDIKRMKLLAVSYRGNGGASLDLYISASGMEGKINGPEDAPARTLRAAAQDLMADHARGPRVLARYWAPWAIGMPLLTAMTASSVFLGQTRTATTATNVVIGVALMCSGWLYPQTERLGTGEKTRLRRLAVWLIAAVVAAIIGLGITIVAGH